MIIGTFRSQDDGFIGHVITLSFGTIAVVFVPSDDKKCLELLIVGKDDDTTIQIGSALKVSSAKGGHLEVNFDCPAIACPICARMKLTPTREGIYHLTWERSLEKKTRKKRKPAN